MSEFSGAELPAWNPEAALERMDQDRELLSEMLALFMDELPSRLGAISDAIQSGDPEALAAAAHALKGSAAAVAAEALSARCAELERMGRFNSVSRAAEVAASLDHLTEEFRAALAAAGWNDLAGR